jgi:hypothetical protein
MNKNAGPRILEPIYVIEVMVPEEKMGDVMTDLQGRRAISIGPCRCASWRPPVLRAPSSRSQKENQKQGPHLSPHIWLFSLMYLSSVSCG